jgi:murein DD-endopeptidase MepM/ murein hydrolase activator NlpD
VLGTAAAIAMCAASARAFEPAHFRLDPPAPAPGDIVRVSTSMPPLANAGSVTFDGRTIPGFVTGGLLNAYFGVDLDVKPGKHPLSFDFGGERAALTIEIHPRAFAVERLTVDKKYTQPDAAAETRIAREAAELNELWVAVTPERIWMKAFVRPTTGPLGSPFGLRRFFNGEPRSPHAGVDLKAAAGTEIVASNTGRVAMARDLFFTGNTVVLDHGLGLYTIYAHLARIDVKEGALVQRSQRIGLVGATGRATGPHLHWGVKLAGARVDPARLPGLML